MASTGAVEPAVAAPQALDVWATEFDESSACVRTLTAAPARGHARLQRALFCLEGGAWDTAISSMGYANGAVTRTSGLFPTLACISARACDHRPVGEPKDAIAIAISKLKDI